MEERMAIKVSEVAAIATAIKDQVTKAKEEILKRIADLETALANVELPAEAETALNALKSAVQEVDDINPDVPPPPPPV